MILVIYWLFMRLPPWMEGLQSETGPSTSIRKALSNKKIWLLGLGFGCFVVVLMSFGAFYPTFLSEIRGYSLPQAALIASIPTLGLLVSAPLAGWVSDRIGSRKLVFSLPLLAIALMMLFPYKVTGWQIYAYMILLGLIVGAVPTATFAAAPEVMEKPELAGLGLAVVMFGQNLGMFIGPIMFGNLVERLGWVTAGYAMIPFLVLGFVAGWMVKVR